MKSSLRNKQNKNGINFSNHNKKNKTLAVHAKMSTFKTQDWNHKITTSEHPFGNESRTGWFSEMQTPNSPKAPAFENVAPKYATIF